MPASRWDAKSTPASNRSPWSAVRLHGITVDMNAISDTVQTLGAVALFADGPTTIRGVGHIRHKETDRIRALATELRKFGAAVKERDDGLTITPGTPRSSTVAIDTYDDHRMAMSMALAGLAIPGVWIRNPAAHTKRIPGSFRTWNRSVMDDSSPSNVRYVWLISLDRRAGRPAFRLRLGRHRRGQAVFRAVLRSDGRADPQAGPTVAR